jgi:hypothetical protein
VAALRRAGGCGDVLWLSRVRRHTARDVSVAGATLIVYLIRRRQGGSITDPGLGPRR